MLNKYRVNVECKYRVNVECKYRVNDECKYRVNVEWLTVTAYLGIINIQQMYR